MGRMSSVLGIALFGSLGVLSRYGVDSWLARWGSSGAAHGNWPWATFGINLVGSFLAALILLQSTKASESASSIYLFLGVGFCGGFTTFSSYALQSVQLVQSGRASMALLYLFASPVLGFALAYIPFLLKKS